MSEVWVEIQEAKDQIDAERVANVYPDLMGADEFVHKSFSENEQKANREALYGK